MQLTIEAGARAGLIGVDDKTISYLKERHFAPSGENLEEALEYWKTLNSDKNASFDKVININADKVLPMVSWGTSPEMVTDIDGVVHVSINVPLDESEILNFILDAVSSAISLLWSRTPTRKFCFPASSAMAFPIPLPAPVMIIDLVICSFLLG